MACLTTIRITAMVLVYFSVEAIQPQHQLLLRTKARSRAGSGTGSGGGVFGGDIGDGDVFLFGGGAGGHSGTVAQWHSGS